MSTAVDPAIGAATGSHPSLPVTSSTIGSGPRPAVATRIAASEPDDPATRPARRLDAQPAPGGLAP